MGAPVTPIVDPLFLVGTTRSGTSLLTLMLGQHADIAFVGELEWIWDLAPRTPELEPYYAWLATHRHYRHHRLQVDRSLTFPELTRSFLEQMRADFDPGRTRRHVGCQVHRHYAQAFAVWPQARFIHIVRDGRDVCASWLKLGWTGSGFDAGLGWRDALAEWQAVKPRIDPGRRIELRFEDLIRFPERELGRLCAFITVPYSPAMLRYHERSSYEPIDPSQAGKWRKHLPRRDVRLFEAMASQDLVANGYPVSDERPYALRPWSPWLLRLESKLRHHRARARRFGASLWLAELLTRWLGLRSLHDRVRLALNDIENAKLQ